MSAIPPFGWSAENNPILKAIRDAADRAVVEGLDAALKALVEAAASLVNDKAIVSFGVQDGRYILTLADETTITGPLASGGTPYDDTALVTRVQSVETALAGITPYDDAALVNRVQSVEDTRISNFTIENGRYVLILTDGSKINGPLVAVGTPDEAPALTAGSLSYVGGAIIINYPAASGNPGVTVTVPRLVRDGLDVLGEVENDRIESASSGVYEIDFLGSNGISPDALITRSLTIGAMAVSMSPDPVNAGEAFTLTFTAEPDSVAASVGGNAVALTGSGLTRSGTAPAGGTLEVTASKANYVALSESFAIAVTPNRAPVAPSIGVQSLMVGEAYSLNAAFNDPDGDSLTYSFVGTLPQGVTRSGAVFSGTPTAAESAGGTLTASDGDLTADLVINWSVMAEAGSALEVTANAEIHVVAQDGPTTTFRVMSPEQYAGEYTVQNAMFAGGPVAIVDTAIAGNPVIGETLSLRKKPLWFGDTNHGDIETTFQWYANDDPIPGTIGVTDYVLTISDGGKAVTCRSTATNTAGSRVSISNAIQVVAAGASRDTFDAPDGTMLTGQTFESAYQWHQHSDTPPTLPIRLEIHGNEVKARTSNNRRFVYRDDPATGDYVVRSSVDFGTGTINGFVYPAGRTTGGTNGVYMYIGGNRDRLYLIEMVEGASAVSSYATIPAIEGVHEVELRLVGNTATASIDGAVVHSITITTHMTGKPGLLTSGNGDSVTIINYGVEDLS